MSPNFIQNKVNFSKLLDLYIAQSTKFSSSEIKDLNEIFQMGMDMFGLEGVLPVFEQKTVEPEGKHTRSKKYEDYGEKIGGAKKDIYQRLNNITTSDIANQPLSKIFPKPDYIKLFSDGIVNEDNVFLLKFLYDNIPQKPRKYGKNTWVNTVQNVINLTKNVIEGQDITPVVDSEPFERYKNKYLMFKRIMKGLGFPANEYDLGDFNIRYFDSHHTWTIVKDHSIIKDFKSFDDAVLALKNLLDVAKDKDSSKTKEIKFDIYRNLKTNDIYFGKKTATKVVVVKGGFATFKEAHTYYTNNKAELENIWQSMKTKIEERRITNRPRKGKDWRNGIKVTPEKLAKTFGFRSIEFGNWVNSTEQQIHINAAYDSLMDLASVLNISPNAIGLNGKLALAFGARGSGNANAHYEPEKQVINLTKTKGAGSLAHEWWHALDNYFSKIRGENFGYITEKPYPRIDNSGKEILAIRPEIYNVFKRLRDEITLKTQLFERSWGLDTMRSKVYWSTIIEMTARAFESFVIDKLDQSNYSNDYLANFKNLSEWVATDYELSNFPYPTDDEKPVINNAYQQLFDTIETKFDEEKNIHSLSDNIQTEPTPEYPKISAQIIAQIMKAVEIAPQAQFARVMKNPAVANTTIRLLLQENIINSGNKSAWVVDSTTLTDNGITLLRESLWKELFPHSHSTDFQESVTDKIFKNYRAFSALKNNKTLFLQFEIALELGKDWIKDGRTFEQYCEAVQFDDPLDAEEFAILCPLFYIDKTDKFEWILGKYAAWNGKTDRASFLRTVSGGIGQRVKTQQTSQLSDVYIWK